MTGLEFVKSQRAVENRGKIEEVGCEVIHGAPKTPAVKGKAKVVKVNIQQWARTKI